MTDCTAECVAAAVAAVELAAACVEKAAKEVADVAAQEAKEECLSNCEGGGPLAAPRGSDPIGQRLTEICDNLRRRGQELLQMKEPEDVEVTKYKSAVMLLEKRTAEWAAAMRSTWAYLAISNRTGLL